MNEFLRHPRLVITAEAAARHEQAQVFKNLQQRILPLLSVGATLSPGILARLNSDGLLSDNDGFKVTRSDNNHILVSAGWALNSLGEIIYLSEDTIVTIPSDTGHYYIYISHSSEYELTGEESYYPGGTLTPATTKSLLNDACTISVGTADAARDTTKICIARVYVDDSGGTTGIVRASSSTTTSAILLVDAESGALSLSGALSNYSAYVPYLKIDDEYIEVTGSYTIVTRGALNTIATHHHYKGSSSPVIWSPIIDYRHYNVAQFNLGEKDIIQLLRRGILKLDTAGNRYVLTAPNNNMSDTLLARLISLATDLTIDLDDGYGLRVVESRQVPSLPNQVDKDTITHSIIPETYEIATATRELLLLREADSVTLNSLNTQIVELNELKALAVTADAKTELQSKVEDCANIHALTDSEYHSLYYSSMGITTAAAGAKLIQMDKAGTDVWVYLASTLSAGVTGVVSVTSVADDLNHKRETYVICEDEVIKLKYVDSTHVNILVRGCKGTTDTSHTADKDIYEFLSLENRFISGDTVTISEGSTTEDKIIDAVSNSGATLNQITVTENIVETYTDAAVLSRAGTALADIPALLGDADTGIIGAKVTEKNDALSRVEGYEAAIYEDASKIELNVPVKGRLILNWTEPDLVEYENIVAYRVKIIRVIDSFNIDFTDSPYTGYNKPDDFINNSTFANFIKNNESSKETDWKRKIVAASKSTALNGAISITSKTVTNIANASDGQLTVTSNSHNLSNGDIIELPDSVNYAGRYTVTNVTTNTFKIAATYVAEETVSQTLYVVQYYMIMDDVSEFSEGEKFKVVDSDGTMHTFTVGSINVGLNKITTVEGFIVDFDDDETVIATGYLSYESDVTINKYETGVESNELVVVFIAAITEYGVVGPWSDAKLIDVPNTIVDTVNNYTFSAYVDDRQRVIRVKSDIQSKSLERRLDEKIFDLQVAYAEKASISDLMERTSS